MSTLESAAAEEPLLPLWQRALTPALLKQWEEAQNFTPEQLQVMAAFRKQLKNEGSLTPMFDNILQDFRWCRARNFDLDKALEMFHNHLNFRKEWKLDSMVDSSIGPLPAMCLESRFPNLQVIKDSYPFAYHKTNKDGLPLYVDCIGAMNAKRILDANLEDELMRFFVWQGETTQHVRLPCCTMAAGRVCWKSFFILDMTGFSITSLLTPRTKAFFKAFSKIFADNYPESVERMVIVNAPWIFTTVWSFVSPLVDIRTRNKIAIHGGAKEYKAVLDGLMDAENLPTQYGGRDASLNFVQEQGLWMDSLAVCESSLVSSPRV